MSGRLEIRTKTVLYRSLKYWWYRLLYGDPTILVRVGKAGIALFDGRK